jgi:pyruvate/2-oxoacid:ferredoxin oxidoreductase beta subunit/Pyruvate/2-oxoacid:ferredoxin oxidoreductase gamma subunit
MTESTFSTPQITTYRDLNQAKYPFCPGCGHGLILDKLNAALVKLQLDPRQVVIVTDIGCSGLSDQYFNTNAFHGLHGRSVTYATGLKLANPELKVIVIMGDGGCGIGGHHLLNAARRNIGVTVVVCNNFNYGMTGGEHSVTTPHGAKTSSTRGGNLERPMDICASVAVNGASFVARATAFDNDLPDLLARAIAHEGFSLLDIWELCTAYFVPNNDFSRSALLGTLESLHLQTGILQTTDYPEYSRAYRQTYQGAGEQRSGGAEELGSGGAREQGSGGAREQGSGEAGGQSKRIHLRTSAPLPTLYQHRLTSPLRLVIAGAAGQKIKSTASLLGVGGVLSGLWVTQRDDYPVTIMSGHSVAEVILSPQEIFYTGIPKPDALLLLAPEGLKVVGRQLAALTAQDTVYVHTALLPIETPARVVPLDFAKAGGIDRRSVAAAAIAAFLRHTNVYPLEALQEAIRRTQRPQIAAENLAALEASAGLL